MNWSSQLFKHIIIFPLKIQSSSIEITRKSVTVIDSIVVNYNFTTNTKALKSSAYKLDDFQIFKSGTFPERSKQKNEIKT